MLSLIDLSFVFPPFSLFSYIQGQQLDPEIVVVDLDAKTVGDKQRFASFLLCLLMLLIRRVPVLSWMLFEARLYATHCTSLD